MEGIRFFLAGADHGRYEKEKWSRQLFSFAVVRQLNGLFSYGLHYLWADFQTFRPVYARQIPLDCISLYQLMFRDVRCSSGRNHERHKCLLCQHHFQAFSFRLGIFRW